MHCLLPRPRRLITGRVWVRRSHARRRGDKLGVETAVFEAEVPLKRPLPWTSCSNNVELQ